MQKFFYTVLLRQTRLKKSEISFCFEDLNLSSVNNFSNLLMVRLISSPLLLYKAALRITSIADSTRNLDGRLGATSSSSSSSQSVFLLCRNTRQDVIICDHWSRSYDNVASNRKHVCLHLHSNLVEDSNVLNSLVLFFFSIIRPLV